MSEKLQQAITAIKAGDKATAQRLLAEIIKAEPDNENAWLWMSSTLEHDENKKQCLQQVLKINPNHQLAQQGLAQLQQKPASQSGPIALPAEPERHATPPSPLAPPRTSERMSRWERMQAIGFGVALVLGGGFILYGLSILVPEHGASLPRPIALFCGGPIALLLGAMCIWAGIRGEK